MTDWEPGQPRPTKPLVDVWELHWLDANGDLRPAGFHRETTAQGEWYGDGSTLYFLAAPFSHAPKWALDGLARAHLSVGGDYVIHVYAADGSALFRVEVDIPRISVSDALRARWLESVCQPGRSCQVHERAMSLPGPEYLPVIDEIRGFVNGHIAVRRADTKPDPH